MNQKRLSKEEALERVRKWFPNVSEIGSIHQDTTDFFKVEYGDVLELGQSAYLIRHNAKEGRFGLDDEVKFWVKSAYELESGERKIIKLTFFEKFDANVGKFKFQCFRSPKKEARILDLISRHPHFMHGKWTKDVAGNVVRVIDYIYGPTLHSHIHSLSMDHETYFAKAFSEILKNYIRCVEAIAYLHQHNEKHGDIRRDHILIDRETGDYRWIDFDFNYRQKENLYSYDLFGLGNILIFITGKGDILVDDLKKNHFPGFDRLTEKDMNIVFKNRVADLKKIFPYIPEKLNRILRHFSWGAEIYYQNTAHLLEDLGDAAQSL